MLNLHNYCFGDSSPSCTFLCIFSAQNGAFSTRRTLLPLCSNRITRLSLSSFIVDVQTLWVKLLGFVKAKIFVIPLVILC